MYVYCMHFEILSHDRRTSSRTPLVQLLRHLQRTYTVANTLQVRTRFQLDVLGALLALFRLFFLLHVLQR